MVTPTHASGMAPTRLMRSIELSKCKRCRESTEELRRKAENRTLSMPVLETCWLPQLTPMEDTYPLVLRGERVRLTGR
jgi:hypothetical protein